MMKTINQASAITGLSYSCIRKLILEKKIQFIKSGTRFYVNMESLLKYCEGGEQ